jgi:hypothetical protein
MVPEEQDPFGEYVSEPQTAAAPQDGSNAAPDEIEITKYGLGKPRRIIVRGTIAADSNSKNRQE